MKLGQVSMYNNNDDNLKLLTDEELIKEIKKNTAKKELYYNELIDRKKRYIWKIISQYPYNLKEDLFQECMLGIDRSIKNYNSNKGKYQQYFTYYINKYIKKYIYKTIDGLLINSDVLENQEGNNNQDIHEYNYIYDYIHKYIGKISDKVEKKILFDVISGRYTLKQISKKYNLSYSTVRDKLYKLRKKLKKIIL